MTGPEDFEIHTVHDPRRDAEAARLLAGAWKAIGQPFPADPVVDRKRRERVLRIRRAIPAHARSTIKTTIAQWLSARAAPASAPAARQAAEEVGDLKRRAAALRGKIEALDEGLRFADTGEAGHEAQGLAQALAGALAEAERALTTAAEWGGELAALLPPDAKGRAGVIGQLRRRGADEALAVALGRIWLSRGLSLVGGADGDGLDILLVEILGAPKAAEKALAAARKKLTANPPELP